MYEVVGADQIIAAQSASAESWLREQQSTSMCRRQQDARQCAVPSRRHGRHCHGRQGPAADPRADGGGRRARAAVPRLQVRQQQAQEKIQHGGKPGGAAASRMDEGLTGPWPTFAAVGDGCEPRVVPCIAEPDCQDEGGRVRQGRGRQGLQARGGQGQDHGIDRTQSARAGLEIGYNERTRRRRRPNGSSDDYKATGNAQGQFVSS
ncbi:unnamed protein product [Phytophthora lilii]|uniref:Unnamed protein product n=1 Tax=Phytophthora lilii TaxID=2077276 RepID=A0A9W6U6K1_9STRA|nr:unnamed protein product [Phytophthora lilii]